MFSRNTFLGAIGVWTIGILACSGMAQAQTARPPVPGLASTKVAAPGMAGNSNTLQVAPQLSVAQLTATSGTTIDLQASFTQGAPVNGASLQFLVDGASVGQGVTGPDGNTLVAYKLPDSFTPGEHTIHVNFKGVVKNARYTCNCQTGGVSERTGQIGRASLIDRPSAESI